MPIAIQDIKRRILFVFVWLHRLRVLPLIRSTLEKHEFVRVARALCTAWPKRPSSGTHIDLHAANATQPGGICGAIAVLTSAPKSSSTHQPKRVSVRFLWAAIVPRIKRIIAPRAPTVLAVRAGNPRGIGHRIQTMPNSLPHGRSSGGPRAGWREVAGAELSPHLDWSTSNR